MSTFLNSRTLYALGFDRATVEALLQVNRDVVTAQADATAAQTTANTGVTNAATAQTTANTGVTNAATAQTSANNAAAYAVSVPNGAVWNADAATGTAPAGDPTVDIITTFYDKAQASVAVRTLRGTLTSAAGTIAVTNVSSSGLTTSYVLVNDGTESVQAQITVTFGDSSKTTRTVSWNFMDPSVAGRTPASGGSK